MALAKRYFDIGPYNFKLTLKLRSTIFYYHHLVFLHSLLFHQLWADISSHLILTPGMLLLVLSERNFRQYLDYIVIHPEQVQGESFI